MYSGAEYEEIETGRKRRPWLKIIVIAVLVAILVAVLISVIVVVSKKRARDSVELKIANRLKVDNIYKHLEEFSNIAQKHSNSRSVINGYNDSVNYVVGKLKDTGLDVKIQYFPVQIAVTHGPPEFKQTYPNNVTYVEGTDFINMATYSGNLHSFANLVAVPNLGCTDEDYQSIDASRKAAVIKRGGCTFNDKISLAAKHGAVAALLYNTGINGQDGPFIGSVAPSSIQTFSLSYLLGTTLVELSKSDAIVLVGSQDEIKNVTTSNIIAETKVGRADRVIVLGSHLDSVPAGPGINDNGSGSATTLEIALQIAQIIDRLKIVNKVRFAWWGAEEIGLLGSTHYVKDLEQNNPAELKNIALNINIDMIASPNYIYGIYNGSGATENIRPGCVYIQKAFEKYLDSVEKKHVLTEFTGRSDYGPFIDHSIPAGGLFTGAEQIKTDAERSLFGGIARAAYDPCYHLACDDLYNLNLDALKDLSKATAAVLQQFFETEDIQKSLNGN